MLQLAKFGGHRYCTCRDMFLLCHVIKQEYVIKGSYDFMSKNLSREITAIPSLVATDTEVFEI